MDDIKMLRTVYNESIKVITRKNMDAICAIQKAMMKMASEKSIKPENIQPENLAQIIKEAKSFIDKDIATYFDTIESLMKNMIKCGVNPFSSMGFVGSLAVIDDQQSINNVFMIDSIQDCVGCINPEHIKKKTIVEQHLMNSCDFFSDGNNGYDRVIAAEVIVTTHEIDKRRATFLTDDSNFHDAFKDVAPSIISKMKYDGEMLSVSKVK